VILITILVVAKVWENLAVSKQTAQKFDRKRFNLRKLNELEVRKEYQIEITKRFATLENLRDSKDINRAWENIKENIKTSAKQTRPLYELKQLQSWFDEECVGYLDQSKQAKMQWLQEPKQNNVDYLNNERREASSHFRKLNKVISDN
jgi:hypothetical protein